MNTRTRLNRLEARSGVKFRVGLIRLLDRDGNVFVRPPEDGKVAGVRISVGSASIELWREEDETLRELEARALESFPAELNPTVILSWHAPFL